MALRQFRLSPSGCQSWHTRVMGSGGNYFVYCSTLAVYVYNLETLALEKLLTGHKRTITCLSWSPHADDVFATCANDAQLIVWSASLGRALSTIAMPAVEGSAPIAIDWSPTREHIVAVADTGGSMHMWDTSARTVSVSYNRIHKSRQGLRVMRWNPHQDQLLASGHADGSLCLYLTAESSVSRMAPKDRSAVVDLQWDPLSPFYMIVAYKAGDISLWDMESETELHQFNRQGTGLRSLAWMEWAPGSFASVNSRTGVIQVWNVSQKHPQDLVRVGHCGFHSMTFVPGSQQALCAFGDGSVAVFHMGKRQTQFHGSPGHTETIFDVQYRPSDANTLATASYDSTVKLWHTPTMECTQTLVGHEGVVYCVSWPGTGDDHIASCSSTGDLFIWNTRTGRALHKIKNHRGPIFRCHWNQLDPTLIATSSGDRRCIVQTVEGKPFRTYQHPQEVYGCHWSPFNKHLLATGCHDGLVRVYDTSVVTGEPIRVLSGHRRRVFNTIWSPLLPNVLASGSDDRTIRVWNISSGHPTLLSGHTNNVRALVWSREVPYILLSGSWDGSIRVWDTRSAVCLQVVTDHHADVYGLDAHPSRPFVFASSSRDTSMRFWILGGVASNLKLRAVLGEPFDQLLGTVPDGGSIAPGTPPRLYGAASMELARDLASCDALTRLEKVFSFFSDAEGHRELWSLARALVDGSPSPPDLVVHHVRDVVAITRARAAELQTPKRRRLGIGGMKKDERLRRAASHYLHVGDVQRYCNIMVQLGEWQQALAVAPAAGLEFWQSLCVRYTAELEASASDKAVPFLVATRRVTKLTEFYEERAQVDLATLVAQAAAQGNLDTIAPLPAHLEAEADGGGSVADDAETGAGAGAGAGAGVGAGAGAGAVDTDGAGSGSGVAAATAVVSSCKVEGAREVKRLASVVAARHSARSTTVMAACAFLAVGNSHRAVAALLKGGEVELAFALASVLEMQMPDDVARRMALRCENLGEVQLACKVLRHTRSPGDEIALLASRAQVASEGKEGDYFEKLDLPPARTFKDEVKSALRRQDAARAVRCHVIAQQHAEAAKLAVKSWTSVFSEATWDMVRAEELSDAVASLPAHLLPDALRAHVIAFMCLVGAMRAMWRRYTAIVPSLFRSTRRLVNEYKLPFPVAKFQMLALCASYLSGEGRHQAVVDTLSVEVPPALLSAVEYKQQEVPPNSEPYAKECAELYVHAKRELAELDHVPDEVCSGEVVLTASLLPTSSHNPGVSFVSGRTVVGPPFVLEDGGSFIAPSEAAMWAEVNPFSPLQTGRRINPY